MKRQAMKRPALLFILTIMALSLVAFARLAYPGHATDEEGGPAVMVFELRDIRVQKTYLAGRFVYTEDPGQYFEISEKSLLLSKSLGDELWITDEDNRKAEIYSFGSMIWVGLNGKIGFYSVMSARPDTFVLQSIGSPMGRRLYKKAPDENEIPLEHVLYFNPEAMRPAANGIYSASAKSIFPNMGNRVYTLEIEEIIGGEISVGRDEIGAIRATFSYQDYVFWYYPERSYDILPAMTVFSRAPE